MTPPPETATATTHADRLAEVVEAEELDQLIVADLVTTGDSGREAQADVFWVSGFSGTSAVCLIGPDQRLFLTDFRYTERAAREVESAFERERIGPKLLESAAERLRGRVGYDEAKTSVRTLHRLEEAVSDDVELVPATGLVAKLRRHKDATEIERIAEAARLTDEVYEWICEQGIVGRTELEVRVAAEQRMRELGASDPSFESIIAAAENGPIGHHSASDREIGAGELVVLDMGAIVDGYCSDCTRTFATGKIEGEAREVYELVRSAQQAGLDAVATGASGVAVDAASRAIIEAAGYGDEFGHGLGHGVGIEVHEPPRLSKTSEDVLEAGDVVTIEPGIYLPGRFGVRIEDLVALTDEGARNLSSFTKELRVVS